MDIPAGTVITPEMLTVKGMGTGLKPRLMSELCGLVAEAMIERDTLIPVEALGWKREAAPHE